MKMNGIAAQVSAIIERVKKEGDRALVYYCRTFDKFALQQKNIRINQSEINKSVVGVDPALRRAIDRAARNIQQFHQTELKHITRTWFSKKGDVVTGRMITPIENVGIYVPGGRFSYPSTVLMAAIPARVAGVRSIAMVTPPGKLTPAVLYAARVSGVDTIYRVGGPAAVAALAYGTKTIRPVDMIVGPGNAYVNEAKRQVFGTVGIDSLAGPSEVAIIADRTAPVAYVLADLMAQAEHDPSSKAFLFTDCTALIDGVRRGLSSSALRQVTIVRCGIQEAVAKVNALAPEHLEIMTSNAPETAKTVKNAGAIFVGMLTPTAVGDYWAGPSHILPTARTARFASVLSVETFLKRTSYIRYDTASLENSAVAIETLAGAEGLVEHRRSVAVRRRK